MTGVIIQTIDIGERPYGKSLGIILLLLLLFGWFWSHI